MDNSSGWYGVPDPDTTDCCWWWLPFVDAHYLDMDPKRKLTIGPVDEDGAGSALAGAS